MATKAELLKHYQEILRREFELESRLEAIRNDLAIISQRKRMLEIAITNESPTPTPAPRPGNTLMDSLRQSGLEMLAARLKTTTTPDPSGASGEPISQPSGMPANLAQMAGDAPPLPGILRRRRMGSDSLPSRILAWMEQFPPEQIHTAEAIYLAFESEGRLKVLDALRRLHDREKVSRPNRGLYQLVPKGSLTYETFSDEDEEAPMD